MPLFHFSFPYGFSLSYLLCFFFMLVPHYSYSQVTGRVVDEKNNPIVNAFISYKNLDNRLSIAYSGIDGTFSIPDPGSGLWHNSGMVVSPTPRRPHSNYFNTGQFGTPRYFGGKLYFTLSGKGKADVTLFTLCGRTIGCRHITGMPGAECSIYPEGITGVSLASGMYLARIDRGENRFIVKIPAIYGSDKSTDEIQFNLSPTKQKPIATAQLTGNKRNAVDEVRVGRTNYVSVSVPINSYKEDVGEITLAYIDITKRIDSLVDRYGMEVLMRQCCMHNSGFDPATSSKERYGSFVMAGHDLPDVGGTTEKEKRRASSIATYLDAWKKAHMEGDTALAFIAGYDAVHGVNICSEAVMFPHNIGLGATRDTALIQAAYRVTAIEMAGTGCYWTFAPTIAVARNDRWGRTYEAYGESPEMVAKMARAAILGLQGTDLSHPLTVAACAKHFAGDGGTEGGDDQGDCNTGTDEVLRKIHLLPYKAALEAEVATIMASFSQWRGVYMHANKVLLTDLLKDQWKFDGWIQGDWAAHDKPGGIKAVIPAGLDMPMPGYAPILVGDFIDLYNSDPEGKERVSDAARRILRIKFRMGLFELSPATPSEYTELVGSDIHRKVARECVRKSLVLLKNDNDILPLKKNAHVCLLGSHADRLIYQCGGWTLGWANLEAANDDFYGGTTIKAGFEEVSAGQGTITYINDGGSVPESADVVVVCIGEVPYAEMLGDAENLALDGEQVFWANGTNITAAAASGKPVVAILISGRPRVITDIIDKCDAFVSAWLPGTEAAGIADVLYGDYDFTGTLPFSWLKSNEQQPINTKDPAYGGDWGDVNSSEEPLFPYGFGLSYHSGKLKSLF